MAFRIPIERSRRQSHTGLGVLVFSFAAEHELVRRVKVRLGNARARVELDQCNRRSELIIPPEHFFRDAGERLRPPGDVVALQKDFLDARHPRGHGRYRLLIGHFVLHSLRYLRPARSPARLSGARAPAATTTTSSFPPSRPAHRRISRARTGQTAPRKRAACRAARWR